MSRQAPIDVILNCIKYVKKCKGCNKIIVSEFTYKDRCNDCFIKYRSSSINFIDKQCEICHQEFESLKDDIWRNRCENCYTKYKNFHCTMCYNKVKILKVKKEGKNKDKLFYKCINCSNFEFIL